MREFVKRNPDAPRGFFACEAAGLAWLGGVADGVPCARGYCATTKSASRWSACAAHRPVWRRPVRSAGGWRDRIALRQLYPLLAHVALFGSGYAHQTAAAARAARAL